MQEKTAAERRAHRKLADGLRDAEPIALQSLRMALLACRGSVRGAAGVLGLRRETIYRIARETPEVSVILKQHSRGHPGRPRKYAN